MVCVDVVSLGVEFIYQIFVGNVAGLAFAPIKASAFVGGFAVIVYIISKVNEPVLQKILWMAALWTGGNIMAYILSWVIDFPMDSGVCKLLLSDYVGTYLVMFWILLMLLSWSGSRRNS